MSPHRQQQPLQSHENAKGQLLWDDVFDLSVRARYPESAQAAAAIVPPPQVSHHDFPVVGMPLTGRTIRSLPLHPPTLRPSEPRMRVGFQILIVHCRMRFLSAATAVPPLVGRGASTGIGSLSVQSHVAPTVGAWYM